MFARGSIIQAVVDATMNLFLACLTGSFVAACAWTFFLLPSGRPECGWRGMIGAWVATLVLAALGQAEAMPWISVFLKGVLLVWLGAFALVISAAVSVLRVNQAGRLPHLCCAVTSIVVNMIAGLRFVWLAVVDPGGV
jgi:hypothetical protein